MVGRQRERLVEVLCPDHGEHGAEDLFLVDAHLGPDLVEEAAAEKEPVRLLGHLEAAPVHHEARALLHSQIDVAPDLVAVLARDERPHLRRIVRRRPDLELPDPGRHRFDQFVRSALAHGHRHRDRHAALARRAVGRAHQRLGRDLDVRVGHHHHVVLRSAQRLHALAVHRAGGEHVFRDRGRADEAHRGDARIGEQRIHRLLVAVHHVQHSRRGARLEHQLGEPQGTGRILFRRLEDEGVAAGDRHREHPHRHHRREIERRDPGAHTERLADRIQIHARRDVVGELAFHQVRDAAGELDHFQPSLDRPLGVGKHLAVLGSDEERELVQVALDQLLEAEHHPRPRKRRSFRPAGEGFLRHSDRALDFGLGGEGDLGGERAGRRIEYVAEAAAVFAADLLAADEMSQFMGFHKTGITGIHGIARRSKAKETLSGHDDSIVHSLPQPFG